MDPEAMYCPVGSKRAAKTSPVCPVSSMTGDCSMAFRWPCHSHQPLESLAHAYLAGAIGHPYRFYEGAILRRAVHRGDCRASIQVRVRLCTLDQLCRAERVGGGSLFAGHCVVELERPRY